MNNRHENKIKGTRRQRLWAAMASSALVLLLMAGAVLGLLFVSGTLNEASVNRLVQAWSLPEQEAQATSDTASATLGSSASQIQARDLAARTVALDQGTRHLEALARQRQIDEALRQLARAREDLARERAAFEAAKSSPEDPLSFRDPAKQFRRSVQLIEAAQPAQTKIWLLTMIDEGRFEDAVATLDAMQTRAASRVLREFESARELLLAGELLEALGRFETGVSRSTDPESPAHAVHANGANTDPSRP